MTRGCMPPAERTRRLPAQKVRGLIPESPRPPAGASRTQPETSARPQLARGLLSSDWRPLTTAESQTADCAPRPERLSAKRRWTGRPLGRGEKGRKKRRQADDRPRLPAATLEEAGTIGDPRAGDDGGGVAVSKKNQEPVKSSSGSFQATRIQVLEPAESPPRWASGTPLETRGESRGVECVHVCVMMVEHQPQECSPVKNMAGPAADKPASSGSSQPGASGDDVTATAGADSSAAATANPPTPAPTTAMSLTQTATRTYPTPPVAKEALLYAPLLVGKYYIEDKRAVWSGKWGMTEAAFDAKGITSPFEMRSQEDVYIPAAAAGSADAVHPAFFGVALARSSRTENDLPTQVSSMFLGYETDPAVRSAMPFHSKYSGFFQIQAVKGKPQTVTEKDVDIRFVHDASHPSFFAVTGSGENRFGVFSLHGFLDKTTNELRMYKIYQPKQPEKRALPRRSRTTKAVATPPAAPKPPVAAVALPPVPAPAVSSVRPTITQTLVSIAAHTPAAVAAPRPVSTPMSDYSSPSVGGRARTVRKPARLRDENVIELDRVPTTVKKCHAILKSLMSSSKATPFLAPVDPVALGIPDYFQVIKEPMDLGTIKQNVECGYYDDPSVFADHVRLVFRNAMLYNAAHSQVHIYAQKLLEEFEKRIKTLNFKMSAKEKTIQSKHTAIKVKKDRRAELAHHSSKKTKGGKGSKGNTKRRIGSDDTGLIMSLKEDIERLKATLEQLQPSIKMSTPKPSKAASRPFKMSDLTEDELNEPMTQQEKARLSSDIKSLPQDKINRVLQIIAEAVPVAKLANENDEIELDINAFDTRCLRMLEGYVRENGIGRKRKRPVPKKSRASPAENRLKSAKVAALNIRYRQEELKSQLAAIDATAAAAGDKRADPDVAMTDVDGSVDASGEAEPKAANGGGGGASDSSSSSSDSSDSDDSDSDSDSESDDDGAAPLERSPSLANVPALSQIESARAEAARKIRDEAASSEPLRVENRGAWSMLAQQESSSPGGKSLIRSEDNESSSLWLSARSMEQQKQQKLQQKERERSDEREAQRRREELETQRRRDAELRDKQREREEAERRAQELEKQQARLLAEKAREAERERAARRAAQREKVAAPEEELERHDHTLSEDLETFSSSSFL